MKKRAKKSLKKRTYKKRADAGIVNIRYQVV